MSVPIIGPDADIIGSLSIVAPLKYDKKFGIEPASNVLNLGRRQIEAGLTLLAAKDRAERAAAVG
jgi:hypothetical protein